MGIHLPEGDFTPNPTPDGGCGWGSCLVVLLIPWLFGVFSAIGFLIDAWILRPLGQKLLEDGTLLFSMDDIMVPALRVKATIGCLLVLFVFVVLPIWFIKSNKDIWK